MKTYDIRVTIDLDLESGEWQAQYNNLSNPGGGIDYNIVQSFLKKIFKDTDKQVYEEHNMFNN